MHGGVLQDEAHAAQLIDQILANGSRVAAIELRRAQELQQLLPAAQFAELVASH